MPNVSIQKQPKITQRASASSAMESGSCNAGTTLSVTAGAAVLIDTYDQLAQNIGASVCNTDIGSINVSDVMNLEDYTLGSGTPRPN